MAEEAQPQQQGPSLGQRLKKFMLPLFAVVNLGLLGAGAYLAYLGTLGAKEPVLREPAALAELQKKRGAAIDEAKASVLYTMPVFTVNLAGSPVRLARLEMTFEMLDNEGFEEIVRNSARVRDEIVRTLNATTFDDIETIQGKLRLKDTIAVSLNQSLKSGVVKDIYFSEFLVQNQSPVQ